MNNNIHNETSNQDFSNKSSGNIRNTLIALLFSFIAAMAIWFFAMSAETPDFERTFNGVVVQLQNADRLRNDHDLSVISGDNVQIYVVLRGQRAVIQRLTSEDIIASVNLMDYPTASTHEARIRFDYPQGTLFVRSNMMNTTITLDRTISRPIHLTIVSSHRTTYPYFETSRTSLPENIIIVGPENLVNRVASARIVLEPLGDLTDSVRLNLLSEDIALYDSAGNLIDDPHISIQTDHEIIANIQIGISREIPLRANFAHGLLNENNTNVTISPASLIVTGSPSDVRALGEYILLDTLNDRTILSDSNFTVPIQLPPGITVRPPPGWTGSADINVELLNILRPMNIPVGNIEIINPLGRDVLFGNTIFRLELRVDRELASSITIDDVLLSIDLTHLGSALGEHSVPVEVAFTPRFEGRAYEVVTGNEMNINVILSEPVQSDPG